MTKNQLLALKPGDRVRAIRSVPVPNHPDIIPGDVIGIGTHGQAVYEGKCRSCVYGANTWFFEEEIEKVSEDE